MKHKVAISERKDSLLKPQTPWPLVQPALILVPNPTNSPAMISVLVEAEISLSGSGANSSYT